MYKITIVDDHHLVAEGFARLINLQKDMNVVSIYKSYTEATEKFQQAIPDLMIVDLSLRDKSGIELIDYINNLEPDIPLITLSMYDVEPYISNALEAGASGYLSKGVAAEELIQAIRTVLSGKQYLSEVIRQNKANFKREDDELNLTRREKEVLKLLAQSKPIKTIASLLDMQPKTVHAHKANITQKLEIFSVEEMRRVALKHHLISVDDLI